MRAKGPIFPARCLYGAGNSGPFFNKRVLYSPLPYKQRERETYKPRGISDPFSTKGLYIPRSSPLQTALFQPLFGGPRGALFPQWSLRSIRETSKLGNIGPLFNKRALYSPLQTALFPAPNSVVPRSKQRCCMCVICYALQHLQVWCAKSAFGKKLPFFHL